VVCPSFTPGSLFTNLILTKPPIATEWVWRNEANTIVAHHKGDRQPGRCSFVPFYSKTLIHWRHIVCLLRCTRGWNLQFNFILRKTDWKGGKVCFRVLCSLTKQLLVPWKIEEWIAMQWLGGSEVSFVIHAALCAALCSTNSARSCADITLSLSDYGFMSWFSCVWQMDEEVVSICVQGCSYGCVFCPVGKASGC